ncbi:MAG: hypothetical protein J7L82_03145, partial [Staphylothermus sp.]|nr:hypothetical protein [Staphylothermus sp.]
LDVTSIYVEINKAISSYLTPICKQANIYGQELLLLLITGDLFKYLLEKMSLPDELEILEDTRGEFLSKYELAIVKYNLIPLCSKCPVNDYLPTKFKEAYESNISLVIESHYPDKIIIGDKSLAPEDVYRMNPISYGGLEYINQNNIEIPEYKIISKI